MTRSQAIDLVRNFEGRFDPSSTYDAKLTTFGDVIAASGSKMSSPALPPNESVWAVEVIGRFHVATDDNPDHPWGIVVVSTTGKDDLEMTGPGAAPSYWSSVRDLAPPATLPVRTTSIGRCLSRELRLSLGREEVGGEHYDHPVIFTNIGPETCSMQGYPSIAYVNAAGARVGATVDPVPDRRPLVILAAGHATTALLVQIGVGVYADCAYPTQTASTSALRVSPPGDRSSLSMPLRTNVCRSASVHQSWVTPLGVTAP